MSTGTPQGRTTTPPQLVGMVATFLPKLLFSCGVSYLKMKHQANKSSRKFKRRMLKEGMNKKQADELTELYLKPVKLSTYVNSVMN